jgi:hypothetical protein
MENLNMYKFMGKIALEYRLSLESVCRLMKIEPTDENKGLVYETILRTSNDKYSDDFQYLFGYETLNEKKEVSSVAYRKALIFLTRYVNAKRRNDKEAVSAVLKELTKTDSDFRSLLGRKFDEPLTEEEVTIISKYRIKYCVARNLVSDILDIGSKKISIAEKKINDDIMKAKLQMLSEYQGSQFVKDVLKSHIK